MGDYLGATRTGAEQSGFTRRGTIRMGRLLGKGRTDLANSDVREGG